MVEAVEVIDGETLIHQRNFLMRFGAGAARRMTTVRFTPGLRHDQKRAYLMPLYHEDGRFRVTEFPRIRENADTLAAKAAMGTKLKTHRTEALPGPYLSSAG